MADKKPQFNIVSFQDSKRTFSPTNNNKAYLSSSEKPIKYCNTPNENRCFEFNTDNNKVPVDTMNKNLSLKIDLKPNEQSNNSNSNSNYYTGLKRAQSVQNESLTNSIITPSNIQIDNLIDTTTKSNRVLESNIKPPIIQKTMSSNQLNILTQTQKTITTKNITDTIQSKESACTNIAPKTSNFNTDSDKTLEMVFLEESKIKQHKVPNINSMTMGLIKGHK